MDDELKEISEGAHAAIGGLVKIAVMGCGSLTLIALAGLLGAAWIITTFFP